MYGKIYESTFTGSMVGCGLNVFAVWGYIIAHTKPDSMVELNPALLSAILGAEVDQIQAAIDLLCSPDPKSRSKEFKGRRLIKKAEFLFFVPQAAKYRGIPNDAVRKEYFAQKQREHRQRVANEQCQTGMSNGVKPGQTSRSIKHKEKYQKKLTPLKQKQKAEAVSSANTADSEEWRGQPKPEEERKAVHKRIAEEMRKLSEKLRSPTAQ